MSRSLLLIGCMVGANGTGSPRPAGADRPEAVPVTMISSSGKFGGAEEVMLSLLDGLGGKWVRSVIFLGDGPVVGAVRSRDIPVTIVRERRRAGLLLAAIEVRRILRRDKPVVVHANHFRAAFVAALATAGIRRRFIWHRHDSTRDGRIAQAVARRAAMTVGVSAAVNEAFRGRVRRRLRVVYNGVSPVAVDRAAARGAVLRAIDSPPNAEIVLLAGRLSPQKGQLDLINAMPRLLAARPGAHVALVGEQIWPYEGYEGLLRDRATELGVQTSVSFLGHLPSGHEEAQGVIRFMAGSDVLVAPSRREPSSGWKEGFGLAPLEAMSAGTPVVGYHHGALPEVLGECARLVPEADVDALADEIAHVLADDEFRERLVACGIERVHCFSPEAAIEGMKRVYCEVARTAPGVPTP